MKKYLFYFCDWVGWQELHIIEAEDKEQAHEKAKKWINNNEDLQKTCKNILLNDYELFNIDKDINKI